MNASVATAALNNPAARNMMAGQAQQMASQGASGFSSYLREENFWSLKILSFFSGLAMFILSVLSLFAIFGVLTSPFDYLISVYFAMFSWVIICENAKDSWPGIERTRKWTAENFGIYRTNIGRGSMMIFLGLLWNQTCTNGVTKVFGWILVGLGCAYLISNYVCCCCSLESKTIEPDVEQGQNNRK